MCVILMQLMYAYPRSSSMSALMVGMLNVASVIDGAVKAVTGQKVHPHLVCTTITVILGVCVYIYMCVCVCERERERE